MFFGILKYGYNYFILKYVYFVRIKCGNVLMLFCIFFCLDGVFFIG